MTKSSVNNNLSPAEVAALLNELLQKGFVLPPTNAELIYRRKHEEEVGLFQMIERLSTGDQNVPDIFDALSDVSLSAVKAFAKIKRTRNWKNGLCRVPSFQSQSERNIFNRALKMLVQKNLVKRVPTSNPLMPVKKGTLMINPRRIKPFNYRDAVNCWDNI